MPASNPPPVNDQFLLGEIAATTKGTAEDVRAMRTEVGDLTRRLTDCEGNVRDIKAERATMVPEFRRFEHKVNNHMQADIGWKAGHDSEQKANRRHIYVAGVVITLIATFGNFALHALGLT